jgi:predicted dehydrogenase
MEGHGRHGSIGRSFGIAVAGLGEGKGLVKGLMGHPELTVVAVCDTDPQRVEAARRQFGVPHGDTEVSATLARPEVDILVIYTPDQLHAEHIKLALEAGKHVICTKPLVTSLTEAETVLELTRRYPKQHLMVGQSSRFFGPMQRQRQAFEAGELGDLGFAEAHYVHDMRWFYGQRPWAREGSFDLLLACCSHPVDLIRWYLGDAVEVSAYGDRSPIAREAGFHGLDTFIVNLIFASGRIGRVLGLYGLEQPHQLRSWIEVALYGSQGTYIAKYPQLETLSKYRDQPERLEYFFEDCYHYFQFEGVNHHAGEFVNYTEYFARCLVRDEIPRPDAIDGYKTMATLEAIRRAIKTGRSVPLVYDSVQFP